MQFIEVSLLIDGRNEWIKNKIINKLILKLNINSCLSFKKKLCSNRIIEKYLFSKTYDSVSLEEYIK